MSLYPRRKPWELEPHFSQHVSAMTSEALHSKVAIAAELAARDCALKRLVDALAAYDADQHPAHWEAIDAAAAAARAVLRGTL